MYKQFVQQKHKVLHTLRQHIALMMLGIFFFPIVFQSMHMMWLSSADIENEHHHCHLAFTQKQATPQSEKVSEEESTCTICTYQYFTNNLPQQLIVTSTEVHLAT